MASAVQPFEVVAASVLRFPRGVPTYRPNVALLLLNQNDDLLICERAGVKGAWQFPQGGMDPGETAREALYREVREEIGLPQGSYEELDSKDGYRYLYPEEVRKKKKKKHDGQEQTYFLCRLKKDAPPIDVDQKPREFRAYRWIKPAEFQLSWLPEFKREVHRAVLRDFFQVEASADLLGEKES